MWYVIQVFSGKENEVCAMIKRYLGDAKTEEGKRIVKECFVPRYQVERKFHGEYKTVTRNLFPGYVIAVTNYISEFNKLLHSVPLFTKVLGSDTLFIPLERNEAAFINSFTKEKHRVIRVSKAVAEGDHIVVVEGPMVGREGWITKINRRKGTARIETTAFGRTLNVEIGLAVVTGKAE